MRAIPSLGFQNTIPGSGDARTKFSGLDVVGWDSVPTGRDGIPTYKSAALPRYLFASQEQRGQGGGGADVEMNEDGFDVIADCVLGDPQLMTDRLAIQAIEQH